jgi:glycerol uptake facilitator-like aquaporin
MCTVLRFTIGVLVYVFEESSGGHANPAVSFAMALSGNISIFRMAAYWVAQFAGAATGAGFAKAVSPYSVKKQLAAANILQFKSKVSFITFKYDEFTIMRLV